MALVMGVLIVSFGVWGIADIFKGFGQSKLAKIGSTEISIEAFRQIYNDRLQQMSRQFGRPLTQEQARLFGLDRQVLQQVVAEAALDGTRKALMEALTTVPLLIIDDLGMRKLGPTAAEELLEIVMRRYRRTSTLVTSNRPVEDWGKLLGDIAAVTAMLDRLLHHGHILKCGPRSWRTKSQTDPSVPEKP